MRCTILIVALLLQAAPSPVHSQSGGSCPNTCPDGMIRSDETGECEPYKPLMV